MDHPEFEKMVAEHQYLNLLINEQKFGTLSIIKRSPAMTDEFIDWISPQYYDAFMAIYKRNVGKSEGAISAVLNVGFLANAETHQKLADQLNPRVDRAISDTNTFYAAIKKEKNNAVAERLKMIDPFNYLTATILKRIDTPEMKIKKEGFGECLLLIADLLVIFSKRRSPAHFNIYQEVIGVLKILELDQGQIEQVAMHEKNLDRKNSWFVISIVLIVVLIIYKVIRHLN